MIAGYLESKPARKEQKTSFGRAILNYQNLDLRQSLQAMIDDSSKKARSKECNLSLDVERSARLTDFDAIGN